VSVPLLSSLWGMDSPPSGPCLLDPPDSAKEPVFPFDMRPAGLDSRFGGAGARARHPSILIGRGRGASSSPVFTGMRSEDSVGFFR